MSIINTRSPYYISITNTSIAYATLDISIFSGDVNGQPSTTYSLRKNIVGSETKISFEISELIRDFLELQFNGDYSDSYMSNGSAKWVNTHIKAFSPEGVQVGSTQNEINLALDGYSYFEEGSSFTMSDKSLFKSDGDIFLPKFGDSNIAIYTGNNPTVLLLDSAGATVRTAAFSSSSNSTEQIKYFEIYPEICVNGDFATDTNWVKDTSDWTISNGASFLNSTDLLIDRIYQSATVIGLNLFCEFTVSDFRGTGVASMRYPFIIDITGNGTYRVEGVGNATVDRIQFEAQANDLSDPLGFSLDNVSVKESYNVSEISVTDDNGTTKENVKQVEECKFKPHKVTFINKNGVLDDMYFFKKSSNSMTTKRESYNANTIKSDNTYSVSQHNKIDFNITANSTVKLSSGFLNESTNERFKQLLLSERVWITRTFNNSELVLPINIKTNSISYKTSLNDKLVEYSIEFEDSYNAINNIR